jgi:hypothetical protein
MRPLKGFKQTLESHSALLIYTVDVSSVIFEETKTMELSNNIEKNMNKESSKLRFPKVRAAP